MSPWNRKTASLLSLLILGAGGSACSTAAKTESVEAAAKAESGTSELGELRTQLTSMSARLENMETQLNSMNDKVDATRSSVESLAPAAKSASLAKAAGVVPAPSAHAGVDVEPKPSPVDPDAAFIHDQAVAAYRNGSILFQARKYPEAVLAFSGFLERFADHPLAGSAQFHVGECYFRQGEYKLSLREYQRVLTSYDRSPHLPDTLKQMALAEDKLKKSGEAVRHRQLLLSLFPQSPAAADAKTSAPVADPAEAVESTPAAPAPAAVEHAIDDKPLPSVTKPGALDAPPPTAPDNPTQ